MIDTKHLVDWGSQGRSLSASWLCRGYGTPRVLSDHACSGVLFSILFLPIPQQYPRLFESLRLSLTREGSGEWAWTRSLRKLDHASGYVFEVTVAVGEKESRWLESWFES